MSLKSSPPPLPVSSCVPTFCHETSASPAGMLSELDLIILPAHHFLQPLSQKPFFRQSCLCHRALRQLFTVPIKYSHPVQCSCVLDKRSSTVSSPSPNLEFIHSGIPMCGFKKSTCQPGSVVCSHMPGGHTSAFRTAETHGSRALVAGGSGCRASAHPHAHP